MLHVRLHDPGRLRGHQRGCRELYRPAGLSRRPAPPRPARTRCISNTAAVRRWAPCGDDQLRRSERNGEVTVQPNAAANEPAHILMPGNTSFIIPACDQLNATLSVTIIDDCDNPISAARASFQLGSTSIQPSFVNAASGYFEFTLPLTVANNGQTMSATYTDAQGAVSTASRTLSVSATPDNMAPVVVYPTQNIVVELNACNNAQSRSASR
jgi:hypothetical protein